MKDIASELKLKIAPHSKLVLGAPVSLEVLGNNVVAVSGNSVVPVGYALKIRKKFVSIGFTRRVLKTTEYDTNQRYSVNANVFVSNGKYTTKRETENSPTVGIVVMPPTTMDANLTLIWF